MRVVVRTGRPVWLPLHVGLIVLTVLAVPAAAQLDGSFWWMNANLLKQAEALRETKDVKAIVITKDSALDEVRVGGNSLVDSDSPDCICVPLNRCNNQPAGRDGLCGVDSVCCRRSQIIVLEPTTSTTPATVSTSTTGPTTKLEPVDGLVFDSDPVLPVLPDTIPYRPVPPNETEHDPNLLLELSNLLLSHSLVDTFEPIVSNALPVDQPTSNDSDRTVVSTTPSATGANDEQQCGRRQYSVSSRIFFQDEEGDSLNQVQAGTVGFSEFPWTVAIYQLIRNGSYVYHCGGAMLNRSVERTVDRVVVHPNYYSGALYNDLALLFFDEPFNDTAVNVEPVCTGESDASLYPSDNCFVTGWGGSPKSNRVQSIQQYSKLRMMEREQCESQLQRLPSLGSKFRLHQSFLCAAASGTDVCQGSGGSPYACERDGRYDLVGIVSWGVGCGDGIPAVLTNVTSLSEWIAAQ
uniref:Peptidase S1 domain-containing protein n=1 Tax=Anopheles epiroticus TaxID=199890 RepID=A0A182PV84_9DIPT